MQAQPDPDYRAMFLSKKERRVRTIMSKQEYVGKAIELATKCKLFAEKTCEEWREETAADSTDWQGLREMREVYLSLQSLRHSADVVLERARLVKA